MITLKLIIWQLYVSFDVWINYRIIEVNDSRPNYLLMNIVRGVAFVLYGRFVWDLSLDMEAFIILVYCTTSFWLLFDIGLNRARKKHPLYIGQHSGWIDQYGFKYPALYYLGKAVALAALIFSIAKIYQ
jgi:hypothetical protein